VPPLLPKFAVQGKSEQMMEYIKKLWACIKWLLERQDANLIEIGNTSAWLEAEGKEHSETGNYFKLTHHG
jgi:kinesin family protein C1